MRVEQLSAPLVPALANRLYFEHYNGITMPLSCYDSITSVRCSAS